MVSFILFNFKHIFFLIIKLVHFYGLNKFFFFSSSWDPAFEYPLSNDNVFNLGGTLSLLFWPEKASNYLLILFRKSRAQPRFESSIFLFALWIHPRTLDCSATGTPTENRVTLRSRILHRIILVWTFPFTQKKWQRPDSKPWPWAWQEWMSNALDRLTTTARLFFFGEMCLRRIHTSHRDTSSETAFFRADIRPG